IPGTVGGGSDPSVAVDDGGLLYLGFMNEDKYPAVAVSADKGKTWTNMYDVGAMVGVKNAVFPAMVAGSAGRAAWPSTAPRKKAPLMISTPKLCGTSTSRTPTLVEHTGSP